MAAVRVYVHYEAEIADLDRQIGSFDV
jgi:hypothetical protein